MIDINLIKLFVFDFDGVLTDNKFYLDEKGIESVRLSRSDGLAFDKLKSLKKKTIILSTEKNSVILKRSEKLKIKALYGIKYKDTALKNYCNKNNISLSEVFYAGNDLNDLKAMNLCDYTACPNDSHHRIKKISKYILKSKGGDGVIREIVEKLFKLDLSI